MNLKNIIGIAFIAAASLADASSIFTVTNRHLFLNNSLFNVQGICYSPTPIGMAGNTPPYGDLFTTTYSHLWARDFPHLRNMGANVIRNYGWTIGADHTAFLDQAYNAGEKPLYVLVNRWINPATDWNNNNAVNTLIAEWEAIADELKNHPAIMGFLIGNEANVQNGNGYNNAFWSAMNQIASAVKNKAPNKLVSIAITDALDQVNLYDSILPDLDFWSLQVYRGHSFGSLFSDYAARSSKPLVITEFGYDSFDGRQNAEYLRQAALPADAMENLWLEIKDNATITAGGCIFEYTDEWWKAGASYTQNTSTEWSGPFVDGEANEEWWGMFQIIDNGNDPDLLVPRAMYYRLAAMWNPPNAPELLENGELNQQPYFLLSRPAHLRDQQIELAFSTNLNDWDTISIQNPSNQLASTSSSIQITQVETNQQIQLSVTHQPASPSTVYQTSLLTNGTFDSKTTTGWQTPGTIATLLEVDSINFFYDEIIHALQLSGNGNYSVPSAFQTTSAQPGDEFLFSGLIKSGSSLPADNTHGIFKIVFQDAQGNDLVPASISIGTSAGTPYPGAESTPICNYANANQWISSSAQAVAPENTETVTFFILNVDQSPSTFYYDSITALKIGTQPEVDKASFFRIMNAGQTIDFNRPLLNF
jgi:hypothetical protein